MPIECNKEWEDEDVSDTGKELQSAIEAGTCHAYLQQIYLLAPQATKQRMKKVAATRTPCHARHVFTYRGCFFFHLLAEGASQDPNEKH